MNIKKIISYTCVIMVSLSVFHPINAEIKPLEDTYTAPYSLPELIEEITDDEKTEETLELTVESAVSYGLENNTSIKMLDNAVDIALVSVSYYEDKTDELEDAKDLLNDATNKLFDKRSELNKAQKSLDSANEYLSKGIAPIDIPLTDPAGNKILGPDGKQVVIKTGSHIITVLKAIGLDDATAQSMLEAIKLKVKSELDSNQSTINEYNIALEEASKTLKLKETEFEQVLDEASNKIGTKIDYSSIVQLEPDDAKELMIKMAGVNLDVTRYAKGIYKNQIAMLIQKNYYDALYAGKILELKRIAKERGGKQYNIVKLSYENGMKAKDDLLLANMYYDSTIISYRLAESTYKNAIVELKKNMNLDMDTKIILDDSILNEVTEEILEDGLESGLTNRIEIQKTLGQLMIYKLNEEILTSSNKYRSKKNSIKEAKLLREGSELELQKTKKSVESEIYQSYETMIGAGEMLKASNKLIKNAEEVVSIAKLKYEQGFGAENSLLKQMNLGESSGTIIELIAAEEKLAEIEAQVAQIRYGYTMAKIKYFNDCGILGY